MQRSNRRVVAVQRSQTATFDAYDRLVHAGIPRQRIEILAPGQETSTERIRHATRTRWTIAGGAMTGLIGGALFGAAVIAALWLLGIFLAQWWPAAVVLVAYAAGAGALAGALIGARMSRSGAAAHARDALDAGRWVVVVDPRDAEHRELAEAVLGDEPLPLARAA